MRYYVEIRKPDGTVLCAGERTADSPLAAATKMYRGYTRQHHLSVAAAQHFVGGDTWHIQWGTRVESGGMNCRPLCVCSIQAQ